MLTFVFSSTFQSWQVASPKLKMQWPCVFALAFPTPLLLSRLPATFKIYQCVHLSHICSTVCVISRRMQTGKHMVAMLQVVAWWSSSFTILFWLCNMPCNVTHNCKLSAPTRPWRISSWISHYLSAHRLTHTEQKSIKNISKPWNCSRINIELSCALFMLIKKKRKKI